MVHQRPLFLILVTWCFFQRKGRGPKVVVVRKHNTQRAFLVSQQSACFGLAPSTGCRVMMSLYALETLKWGIFLMGQPHIVYGRPHTVHGIGEEGIMTGNVASVLGAITNIMGFLNVQPT